jgi:hypothetical protein
MPQKISMFFNITTTKSTTTTTTTPTMTTTSTTSYDSNNLRSLSRIFGAKGTSCG